MSKALRLIESIERTTRQIANIFVKNATALGMKVGKPQGVGMSKVVLEVRVSKSSVKDIKKALEGIKDFKEISKDEYNFGFYNSNAFDSVYIDGTGKSILVSLSGITIRDDPESAKEHDAALLKAYKTTSYYD